MRLFDKPLRINLALQGGGAHGAFTWGVLDRLLEENMLEIGWVSATSAGAVNAAALAGGFTEGGADGARAKLRTIWNAVHKAGVPDLLRLNPILYGLSKSASMLPVTSLMSPYDFNPLDFNPLRRLLNEHIDFARLRAASPIELLIAATTVSTGRLKLFERHELTAEMVLASACLPTLHHAIEIDGAAYWDGGFSANPDILHLAERSPVRDTLIVQLNPLTAEGVPTGVREIAGHVNRMTFNAPLLRDVEIVETARAAGTGWFGGQRGRNGALARHRFHVIEAGRYTAQLPADSKMKPELQMLTFLHGAGRTEAQKWLERNRRHVGSRSSVDLGEHFLRAKPPPPPVARPVRADDETPPPRLAQQR